jgi:hypothetical protein
MSQISFCGPSYSDASLNSECQRTVNLMFEAVESGMGKGQFQMYRTPGLAPFCYLDNPLQNSNFKPHQNQGAWNNVAHYVQFDCVTFGNPAITYACLVANTNQEPDTNPASWFPVPVNNSPVRGIWTITPPGGLRCFAVGGSTLFEIFADGSCNPIASVLNDGNTCSFAASSSQLALVSGGILYVFNLNTGAFVAPPNVPANLPAQVVQVGFDDFYFIALCSNGQFQTSALADATSWSALDVNQPSVFPDAPNGMIVDHRELWIFSPKAIQPYYDSGDPNVPFQPVPGGFMEQGLGATFSPMRLDNSVFWLGADERGFGMAWRAQGYVPNRISNHAIEQAWQTYPTLTDAICFPIQFNGHPMAVFYFPSAKKTWVYDVAVQNWVEWEFLDPQQGQTAHRGQCHAVAFGQHLMGDRATGTLYSWSLTNLNDFGNPILCLRRAPHISTEQQYIFHGQVQLDCETGLLPQQVDDKNNPREPQVTLKWSDTQAKTWSSDHIKGLGEPGDGRKRVIWRRLGKSRDRIYELRYSDSSPLRIINLYLQAEPDMVPKKRLSKSYAEMA